MAWTSAARSTATVVTLPYEDRGTGLTKSAWHQVRDNVQFAERLKHAPSGFDCGLCAMRHKRMRA